MRELLVLYLQLFCMYKLVQIKKVLKIKMQEKKERTLDCAFTNLKLCQSLPYAKHLTLKAFDGSRALLAPPASWSDTFSASLGFSNFTWPSFSQEKRWWSFPHRSPIQFRLPQAHSVTSSFSSSMSPLQCHFFIETFLESCLQTSPPVHLLFSVAGTVCFL